MGRGRGREEVPCGRHRDSRNGVQTHFADLVNNPGRVDARPARNGSEPTAGFLFPCGRFKAPAPPGRLPSGLPGRGMEPAAQPRPAGDSQDLGAGARAPEAPPPSAPIQCHHARLLPEQVAGAAAWLSPKGER